MMTNTNDLLILIQQDRKDLADLTRDFSKADKDTRANRADKATNQVIMMINGANAVIHPPLQQNVDEGVERVVESIYRMKILADEFDRLERMSFEDLAYPAIFDQTFNRFFDLWEHESRSANLLRDVMRDADFDLLAPRWQVIRETTPTRLPVRSVLASHMERTPTAETPKPKPKPQAPEEEGGELKEEKRHPLTLSQCMKQLLEQAEEMMSKAKISSPTSGDKKKEDKKLECGCTENCSCAKAKEGGSHKEKENAHKTEEKGKKLDCGCTGICACPSSSSSPGTKTEKAPEGAKKKKQEAQV